MQRYDYSSSLYEWLQVISIKVEQLELESSASCADDHVAIYDGKDASFPLLARLCGSKAVSTQF